MRRLGVVFLVLVTLGLGAGAYYYLRPAEPAPQVTTAPVTRGDVVETVGATGTLEAVTAVQVGTQVSGTIKALHADFNSIVHRGQVIARLDPSLFETQVEQARANLVRAQAEVERLRVNLDDARVRLQRAEGLAARNLIPQSDLEAAQVNVRSADAQLRSTQAQLTQAQASLNQTQVNLQHTVITSPIDGIVVSRNVDVGQTVAAGLQAPTLFVLAADLAGMRVVASIDEADIGRIRPGQRVRFRVDAYPTEEFTGTVSQVRLQPVVAQNVVTYATVIDVPNPELKLKPGMTANVTIEIARREDIVRIPNAAVRFRPSTEVLAALGQAPPELPRAVGEVGSPPGAAAPAPESVPPRGDSEAQGRRGWPGMGTQEGVPDAERRRRFMERLQNLPEAERERVLQRMREGGWRRGEEAQQAPAASRDRVTSSPAPARAASAGTIDSLFGPLPPVESSGRVWVYGDGRLKPIRVRLGISDGTFSELLAGDLQPDMQLVTNVITAQQTQGAGLRSPLMPQRGPGPGGGPPGVRNPAQPSPR